MRFALAAALAGLALPALAQPPVPRKSPELEIVEASGKKTLLSSYKGKVCAVEFMFTTCPHCQAASMMFSRIYKDLGPEGFLPIGIAFNEGVSAPMVNQFVHEFGATYPIGLGRKETVLSFLGISIMDMSWVVPQIAIIDRKGMIRAQTAPKGSPEMQTETWLRAFIGNLLKEGAATSNAKKPPTPPKKAG